MSRIVCLVTSVRVLQHSVTLRTVAYVNSAICLKLTLNLRNVKYLAILCVLAFRRFLAGVHVNYVVVNFDESVSLANVSYSNDSTFPVSSISG